MYVDGMREKVDSMSEKAKTKSAMLSDEHL